MITKDDQGNDYFKILIVFALVLGFALTIMGASGLPWPQANPWADTKSVVRFLGFLITTSVLVSLFTKRLHINILLAFLVTASVLAIATDAFWALLVVLWFFGASILTGHWVLAQLTIRHVRWLNCFLVGAGFYGVAVGLLAHFPVNYSTLYAGALALPPILGWRLVLEARTNFLTWLKEHGQRGDSLNKLDLAIGVVALIYIAVALMPELGFDALASHLFVPAHLLMRHKWAFDVTTYVWAVMPMMGDWIFSIAYMLAGEVGVRFLNAGFILILSWLVRDMVLWAGGTGLGARWAVLIFLTTPLTFTEGSSLYIESIWASFAVAGAFAVLKACFSADSPKAELTLAALLLGYAISAKAVSFTLLPVLFLVLAWRYKSWYKAINVKTVLLACSLFLLIGSIPYVTAWRLTGNPVFPLFNAIFKSSYFPDTTNFFNPKYTGGLTWDVIYRMAFDSNKYIEGTNGASGFQWLLLLVPTVVMLIALRNGRGLILFLVSAATFIITFKSQSYLRYIFPSSVILASAMGVVLSTTLSARGFVRTLWFSAITFALLLNILFLHAGNGFYNDFAIQYIFDRSDRNLYLTVRAPVRKATELVNLLNIEQGPVAVFAEPFTAGMAADALYANWYNTSFQSEIAAAKSEADMVNIFQRRGVTYIILDSNWRGVNCCSDGLEKQKYIEKASERIASFGTIDVRKAVRIGEYQTELLTSWDFSSLKGWDLGPQAKYDPVEGIVLASESSPAVQRVRINAGKRYLNSVIARCAKETTVGRVQINWIDEQDALVSVDIRTYECTSAWEKHTMEVTAPPRSVRAIVYVSGHTGIPMEFKSNSLRQ